jgi:predicted RNA-binding protein with RPS1 domain
VHLRGSAAVLCMYAGVLVCIAVLLQLCSSAAGGHLPQVGTSAQQHLSLHPHLTALQVLAGKVRRVEAYGVFIDIEGGSRLVGLCHISQVADEKVVNLAARYRAGQAVRAKVLGVDLGKGRLTLGLRPSLFEGGQEEQGQQGSGSDEEDLDQGGW